MADIRLCVAEIPSFTADDAIDTGAVRNAAKRLAGAGFVRIAVGGFFGEYNQLTNAEQAELIRAAVDGAGEAAVCAGVMDAATGKAAERVREHAALGCHTHICVPSYYFSNNAPGELTRHFSALREADPVGCFIIGDSRAHVGYNMAEDMLRGLNSPVFEYEPDAARAELLPRDLPVLTREELALAGASDRPFISLIASAFPNLAIHINELSAQVRRALLSILTAHTQPAAGVKYAAQLMGLCASGELLGPFRGLDAEQRQLVEKACGLASGEEARLNG